MTAVKLGINCDMNSSRCSAAQFHSNNNFTYLTASNITPFSIDVIALPQYATRRRTKVVATLEALSLTKGSKTSSKVYNASLTCFSVSTIRSNIVLNKTPSDLCNVTS